MAAQILLTPREFHTLLVILRPSEERGYFNPAKIAAAVHNDSVGYIKGNVVSTQKALNRLEEVGLIRRLITKAPQPLGGNGRITAYYDLTEAGLTALRTETTRLNEVIRRAQVRLNAYDEGRLLDQYPELLV